MDVNMKVFVTCLALIISNGEGKPPNKIIGGLTVQIEDYPYQVSLRRNGKHICSGSIIDNLHILTAAHCIVDEQNNLYGYINVLSGTSNYESELTGQIHIPHTITIHDTHFTRSHRRLHDIAIIKLTAPIHFTESQNSIKLPLSDRGLPGTKALIIGSESSKNESENPEFLRRLVTTVISNDECFSKLKIIGETINPDEVCAQNEKKKGICNGDSGGSLIYGDEIIGILSYTITPCAVVGLPDIYARVYKYLPWINDVIQGKTMRNMYHNRIPSDNWFLNLMKYKN